MSEAGILESIQQIIKRPFQGRGLTPKVESVINLAGLGYQTPEIAELLDITPDAVKKRMNLGNAHLKTKKKDLTKMVFSQIQALLDA